MIFFLSTLETLYEKNNKFEQTSYTRVRARVYRLYDL